MNKKSFEYIVKAKNTKIEYEIIRKVNLKIFFRPIIFLLIGCIIASIISIDDVIKDISVFKELINIKEFRILILQCILYIIILCLGMGFLSIVIDLRPGLKKIKTEDDTIFIKKGKKEYQFKYEDLIKIRVFESGKSPFRNCVLYIYYLQNFEIKEFMTYFPKQNLNKIIEICSIFITNYNTEKIVESDYHNIRSKEKDEVINKVLNDEIIW